MQVKGFAKNTIEKLEKAINEWLNEHTDVEIIDIKYDYDRGMTNVFSALIIYKKK